MVNEAIDDNPQNFLRNSKWLEIIGDDFLTKAFEFAHAADPDAKLFYNDYNIIIPEKRDRVLKLIDKLKAEGAPINGIGIQGHWFRLLSNGGMSIPLPVSSFRIFPGP